MKNQTFTSKALPRKRQILLNLGTLLALSVYYLNYGATFDEGEIHGVGPVSLMMRIGAVCIIVISLTPIRFRCWPAWILIGLYVYGLSSLLFVAGLSGGLNDSLFFNTMIQLPILLALVGTQWVIDYARWLKFFCMVLAAQVLFDAWILQTGQSLWQSKAFVGGVGNPSSFALLCVIGLTFCIFHPLATRAQWLFVIILTIGAIQTKAMFAVFSVAIVACAWMITKWRLAFRRVFFGILLAITSMLYFTDKGSEDEFNFLENKLKAAGSLIGLVEYDVDSSSSVSARIQMHETTFSEIINEPFGLFFGHLNGLPYWPMDSQLLTYLGSFGAIFTLVFLYLHVQWITYAWRKRRIDNGFAMLSLCIFGLIFFTNRILDYFPSAMIYFLIVSSVIRGSQTVKPLKQGKL